MKPNNQYTIPITSPQDNSCYTYLGCWKPLLCANQISICACSVFMRVIRQKTPLQVFASPSDLIFLKNYCNVLKYMSKRRTNVF